MKPVRRLRELLTRLKEGPGLLELRSIRLEEIPALMHLLDGRASVYIERVKDYGFGYAFGTLDSRRKIALALGVDEEAVSDYFHSKANEPKKPRELYDVDLELRGPMKPRIDKLPVPKHYERDLGPYITIPVVFVKNPANGFMNASVHRMRVIDSEHAVIRMVEGRHLHIAFTESAKLNKDLNVVVEIGASPLVELAASHQSPPEVYEAWIANSLSNEGLRFTEVNGLVVPLSCEIMLTGRIMVDKRERDLMMDVLGLYDKERLQPVVEFHEMYVVKDEPPIYRGLLPASKEHRTLMSFSVEVKLEKSIRSVVPGTRRVVLTEASGKWLHAVVQITKRLEGDAKNAILAAFATHPSLKHVVVIDDDLDPESPQDVEFALATRFQASRDLVIVPRAKGSSLDPSGNQELLLSDKVGVDATIPLDKPREMFKKGRVYGSLSQDTIRLVRECLGMHD